MNIAVLILLLPSAYKARLALNAKTLKESRSIKTAIFIES
jgi:hypothetical protein